MAFLIRIQKKLENKWLHKHGEHGKPVYYPPDPEEVVESVPRTSTSGARPASRLRNLSFLATRRTSSHRHSTDTPPRSPSFFCRGSDTQPNARRFSQPQHARNDSDRPSPTSARRSGGSSWPFRWRNSGGGGGEGGEEDPTTTRNDSSVSTTSRFPAFPDSGYVSRDSHSDLGFLPQGNEPLASPSQLGNSMTLGGTVEQQQQQQQQIPTGNPVRGLSSTAARGLTEDRNGRVGSEDLRARASSLTLGDTMNKSQNPNLAMNRSIGPSVLAENYQAPSAISNQHLEQDDPTSNNGLRGFEGDRDGYFSTPTEPIPPPQQPAPSRAAAVVAPARPSLESAGRERRDSRTQFEAARRMRRSFTTTRALTGYC